MGEAPWPQTCPLPPPQPSQLFTLGASEHSPLKTPYFDAGISCTEQVGAQEKTDGFRVLVLRVKGQALKGDNSSQAACLAGLTTLTCVRDSVEEVRSKKSSDTRLTSSAVQTGSALCFLGTAWSWVEAVESLPPLHGLLEVRGQTAAETAEIQGAV